MTFTNDYLLETCSVLQQIDQEVIERMTALLREVRDNKGRLFIVGVGGSAANASHAVADFRKTCGISAYALESFAEWTARSNDDGWEHSVVGWLQTSNLERKDALLVLSVGGGSLGPPVVSEGLVRAIDYARVCQAKVLGVVARDGGYTKKMAATCILLPTFQTPHAEEAQSIILHLLASHPALKQQEFRWESIQKGASRWSQESQEPSSEFWMGDWDTAQRPPNAPGWVLEEEGVESLVPSPDPTSRDQNSAIEPGQRAVFLDRDGVLNDLVGGRAPWTLEDLKIVPTAFGAVQNLRKAGFVTIIVTNQPDVAKGNLPLGVAEKILQTVKEQTGVDAAYLCPHSDGQCECRKPKAGMLRRASQELGIDLIRSYMVGDTWRDKGAADAAGVRYIFAHPKSLLEVSEWIAERG